MIEELRLRLQALQRPPGIDDDPGVLPLGVETIDGALGGGLARGALHEIAASGEAHVASAAGFVLGLSSLGNSAGKGEVVWVAEDMTLTESGEPYGPGLEAFGLRPERLVTVQAARTHDLLWAMEEALRCRAVATVIGEMREGEIDGVAVRRLSLAAAESGALALLLRATPPTDASTAATRWIVGASPSPGGGRSPSEARRGGVTFAVSLIRNRRGPTGSWILQWSDIDERFLLATHAQPVAAPLLDRPHRQVA
ncbi:MAG TPA: DNA repair protein [Pseudolabrys sp.]|jgi:protein ImuA|nr:DNA repair protein [Pseudolabrys sp.]